MADRFHDAFPILNVADMQRSLGFYCDQLGFEVEFAFPQEGDPRFAQLAVDGGKLGLASAEGPVQSGSTAIWLYTDDVDAALRRLRDAGAPVLAEPADQPWGERVASVADPDGYVVHMGAPATGP
jgi:lactoylglutathione lyase